MSPEPTMKQIRYAEAIHDIFHEPLPEFTKVAYSNYIGKYHQAMKDRRYVPTEEDLYDICENDVWCEYY